ncbi:MAG: glycosyltransferase family 39 protein [Candidatus Altiarchaeota archaeon]
MKSNKKKYVVLLFVLTLYIFARLIVLFGSSSDKLYFWEECHRGTIAKEIIEGQIFNLFEYQWTPYEGGSLLEGILAVPFFLILGQTGFSLKLVALVFSIGTLIVTYSFLYKFFNLKSAAIASLLLIFSPQYYTVSTLITQGNYVESMFFSLCIMYLFYQIFFDKKISYKYFALFGFLCGFALWFHYINLVMITLCILFWFIFDKIFFLRKKFLVFIIFFAIGFSPFIYYGATHEFKNLDMFKQGITDQGINLEKVTQASKKFEKIVVHGIVDSLYFPNFFFINGRFVSHFYYMIFLVSVGFVFWINKKSIVQILLSLIPLKRFQILPQNVRKELFVLSYFVLYILIYSYSRYEYCCPYRVDILEWVPVHKYKLLLYPFMFILLAIFTAKLYESKIASYKVLSVTVLLSFLAIGFYSNLSLISIEKLSSAYYVRHETYEPYCYGGYEYRFWGENWNWEQSCSDLKYEYENCAMMDEENQVYCNEVVTWVLNWRCNFNALQKFQECRNSKEWKTSCFKNFAMIIGWRHGLELDEGVKVCGKFVPEYRDSCYLGLGWIQGWLNLKNPELALKDISGTDKRSEEFYRRGVANFLGWRYKTVEKCKNLDASIVEYCHDGLSENFAENIPKLLYIDHEICYKIPEEYRDTCLEYNNRIFTR